MSKRANKSQFSPLEEVAQGKMLKAISAAKAPASAIAAEFGVSRNTVVYHAEKMGKNLPLAAKPKAAPKKKAKSKGRRPKKA